MRQVVGRMGMSGVTIAYGMTETSPVSFQSALDDPLERRVTTIGRVQPHLEVKAIDESGQITPRGVPGELCTRGYSVMLLLGRTAAHGGGHRRRSRMPRATGHDRRGRYGNIVGRIKDTSSGAVRTFIRAKSRSFSTRTPRSPMCRWWGSPTPVGRGDLRIPAGSGETGDEAEVRDFVVVTSYCKIPRYIRFVEEFP
jgi:fatty-acyl-CoA synthase